jgi:hypothetical protein
MPGYTIYSAITRRIVQSGSHPEPELIPLAEGEQLDLSGSYPGDQFEYDGAGNPVPIVSVKSAGQLQREIVAAVQMRLDDFARSRGYDSILSACTYATSAVPQFSSEGQYAVRSRDETWRKLYEMLAEVQTGTRTVPTSFTDIEGELPALSWP